MRGIAAYGAYVPYWRLDRKAIATALGALSGSGTRSVASYDEDTTSLGVEAARAAVRAAPHLPPGVLYFATAQPAYLDKTNATAIHAALDLAPSSPAYDMADATVGFTTRPLLFPPPPWANILTFGDVVDVRSAHKDNGTEPSAAPTFPSPRAGT